MNRILTRIDSSIGRRSALVALTAAAAVSMVTTGTLFAAGPKIKSRTAVPAGHTGNDARPPSPALAAGVVENPGAPPPPWFPQGPGSATGSDALRKLLLKYGDKDGNGCLDKSEAYLLYFSSNFPSFYLWLIEKGYLRDDPARRKEIVDLIQRKFAAKGSTMDAAGFRRFLQSLGLMCSAASTVPTYGGGGGGSMLPELPW
jgi:hypothetical protein